MPERKVVMKIDGDVTVYEDPKGFSKHLPEFVPSTGNGTHPETFRVCLNEDPPRKKFMKMPKAERKEFQRVTYVDFRKDP